MSKRTFNLYTVENREGPDGEESFWNKVGGGVENRDGSISLNLHMFPTLWIQCREHIPQDERQEQQSNRDSRNTNRQNHRRGNRS